MLSLPRDAKYLNSPLPWTVHHDINFEAIINLMHKYLYSCNITTLYILDFKLSPCSECCMISFGLFSGV